MSRTIVIVGFGPGNLTAVAEESTVVRKFT